MVENRIMLVTGGARSGKSTLAEEIAGKTGEKVVYLATSEVHDEEMEKRVRKHREQRPEHWITLEEPLHPEKRLCDFRKEDGIILMDCLTLWVSNLLLHEELPYTGADFDKKEEYILKKTGELLYLLEDRGIYVVLVTNETGQGVVPDNPLARAYRDIVGRVNQLCAARASSVYAVFAGIPVDLKKMTCDPALIAKEWLEK